MTSSTNLRSSDVGPLLHRRRRLAAAAGLALAALLHIGDATAQSTLVGPGTYDPRLRRAEPPANAERAWQQGSASYDRRDYRSAMTAYQAAAAQGDVRAMAVIGTMYREGQGVAVDKKQAAQWYERAAAGGHRAARFSLADMLESGDGVARDVPRAAQLYEQSARQGFPEAQFALGISYEFGQGVPRDRRTAIQWLDRAAAQGDGRARWFSSWLKASATPRFDNPDGLRDYVNRQVDARMMKQMGAGNRSCAMAQWVCSRERAEAIWKSEYHPPNTPNPFH
ncbi:MAG: tetratricopeptide repeat protein [Caldimonas sp.]